MILTKYFRFNYGYDVLENLRLKVSDPLEFNDPFEMRPYVEGEITRSDFKRKLKHPQYVDRLYRRFGPGMGLASKKEFKTFLRNQDKNKMYAQFKPSIIPTLNRTLEVQKSSLSSIAKILCFSRSDLINETEEILMWAHYSEAHRGIRISFDTEKMELRSKGPKEVKYQEERIRLDAKKVFWEEDDVLKLYSESLTMKSSAWKYEHEYRWLISNLECFSDGKSDFIRIKPEAIVRVDIGVNSTTAFQNKLIELIRLKKYFHIDVMIAELDEKNFKLNYKEVKLP
jgi:hypothetical protein